MTASDSRTSRRPPRYWTHVDVADEVRDGDVLSFKALDGRWREANVRTRARDVGRDAAWWVDQRQYEGLVTRVTETLVVRAVSGALVELDPARVPGLVLRGGRARH